MRQPSPEEIEQAEAKLRHYQKLSNWSTAAFAIVSVNQFLPVESRLHLGVLGGFLWVALVIAVMVSAVHALRCTMCGGGLKINGRTCSKCGHDFKKKWGR